MDIDLIAEARKSESAELELRLDLFLSQRSQRRHRDHRGGTEGTEPHCPIFVASVNSSATSVTKIDLSASICVHPWLKKGLVELLQGVDRLREVWVYGQCGLVLGAGGFLVAFLFPEIAQAPVGGVVTGRAGG
jgi:hypothetical protein